MCRTSLAWQARKAVVRCRAPGMTADGLALAINASRAADRSLGYLRAAATFLPRSAGLDKGLSAAIEKRASKSAGQGRSGGGGETWIFAACPTHSFDYPQLKDP